jgi:hypothetical protein
MLTVLQYKDDIVRKHLHVDHLKQMRVAQTSHYLDFAHDLFQAIFIQLTLLHVLQSDNLPPCPRCFVASYGPTITPRATAFQLPWPWYWTACEELCLAAVVRDVSACTLEWSSLILGICAMGGVSAHRGDSCVVPGTTRPFCLAASWISQLLQTRIGFVLPYQFSLWVLLQQSKQNTPPQRRQ